MAVVTGSNLQNPADVAALFMDTILNQMNNPPISAGAGLSYDRNTGTVPANSIERWLTIPAARTAAGRDILYGLRAGDTDRMESNTSELDFTTASVGDTRAFNLFDGQPQESDTTAAVALRLRSPNTNGFNTGANYLNHWIITNPNFGNLTAEYAAGERLYAYMIIQIDPTNWRCFGFCEAIQIGTWPTTASGLMLFGTYLRPGDPFGSADPGSPSENLYFASHREPQFSSPDGNAHPMVMYQPDRDGVVNNWMIGEYTIIIAQDAWNDILIPNEIRRHGRDVLRDPSVFSGVALRTEIVYMGTRLTAAQVPDTINKWSDASITLREIAKVPDVFWCNIRDLTPGGVFVDGGERFLVVPLVEKDGFSGNHGMLFRNPAV